jgi:Flp pilus assembly protein TadG
MNNHQKFTRKGQSTVEFALIIPAFLLMAVMVFDLGRAVYYSSAIHNAAREAARYGIVHPSDETGMKAKAINYAVGLGLQDADVTIDVVVPEDSTSYPPPRVTVYVNYDFFPATPLVSNFISGGQFTLKGEATMKLEALP